jgi:hypothetical protein
LIFLKIKKVAPSLTGVQIEAEIDQNKSDHCKVPGKMNIVVLFCSSILLSAVQSRKGFAGALPLALLSICNSVQIEEYELIRNLFYDRISGANECDVLIQGIMRSEVSDFTLIEAVLPENVNCVGWLDFHPIFDAIERSRWDLVLHMLRSGAKTDFVHPFFGYRPVFSFSASISDNWPSQSKFILNKEQRAQMTLLKHGSHSRSCESATTSCSGTPQNPGNGNRTVVHSSEQLYGIVVLNSWSKYELVILRMAQIRCSSCFPQLIVFTQFPEDKR